MTNQQRYYCFLIGLYSIATLAANTFTNLYLWQSTNNFQTVILYNMYLFLGVGFCGLAIGLFSKNIPSRISYIISSVLYCFQLILLTVLGSHVTDYLLIIGLCNGLAIGTQSTASHTIMQLLTSAYDRNKFLGTLTAITNGVPLLFVPLSVFVIGSTHSYTPIFTVAAGLFVLVCFLSLRLQLSETSTRTSLSRLWFVVRTTKQTHIYLKAKLLFGIQDGLFGSPLALLHCNLLVI